MSKVTIKVEKVEDVRDGDFACGNRVSGVDGCTASIAGWTTPCFILHALCASGHVTREVDAKDAVEWCGDKDYPQAKFGDRTVGWITMGNDPTFTVRDSSFTTVIWGKFLELTAGKGGA